MESMPTVGTDGPAIMDTPRTITTEVVEDRPCRVAVVAADNIATVTMTTGLASTGQNGATTRRPVSTAKTRSQEAARLAASFLWNRRVSGPFGLNLRVWPA